MIGKEKGLSLIEVMIGILFFSVISLSVYDHYNRSAEQHYINNISIVMCRYADALSYYLQEDDKVNNSSVSLSELVSSGYLPSMPEGASVGGYKIKMYVDNKDNGLIALYGDEHYSLTIKSMKPFLGIRGASVEGDKIISTGGYYSLPVSGFTNFSTDNLRGLMLIPSIQTSGQNCDRGGYDF
ncbi:TPA: prepilin-type N-terminal cleavage/methylation domain-containing protein [Escherichia coli]|uniref:PulJ/GspJ family protein n=1 Tax=Escherichia coli TaxID=562 RepID=UPI0007A0718A|nr:prepilin-type N-terminal cleavage/methylation domain-containing protein [Escherichia coli]EFZ2275313.1 prepilin-type N-terminal cleavage/methylation domain-containing protein [Shigella sonnei]EEQ2459597.1 prepilin-type N-terminal cleavage/methylation domain-containing protein [Escherichia coli]EEQ6525985.1 prepilin-type N-terminal cleavage/methylation domain-containing protein [Escherichia coli]EEQ9688047.1 prepilin-type N-terminal cleavage/methylation domain-containing protein [Escherichia 